MDLNGDGNLDILSGSYCGDNLSKMAGLFQVLWGKEDGTFQQAEPLKGADGKLLIIQSVADSENHDDDVPRICTRPTAVDFDGDGDLDLVVGNFEGSYYLFRGEGGGKFGPKSERILVDGKPLNTGHHSDPFFADWDGDGDLDLLTGASVGGVVMIENTAGAGKEMVFGKSTNLISRPKVLTAQWNGEQILPSDSTRVIAEDLNGDGKLDLIVGDRSTVQTLSEGYTKESAVEALADWEKEMKGLSNEMSKVNDKTKTKDLRKKMQDHIAKRKEILKEDQTGFVWIYYQK